MLLLSLAALALELLITRIFSATLYYHYAFLVLSLAMLGLSAGGLWVYLRDPPKLGLGQRLAHLAVGFALSAVLATGLHLWLPHGSLPEALHLFVNYVAFAVPFGFAGAFFADAFAENQQAIGKLYAADLIGAALGAAAAAGLLAVLDGPSAVIAVALVGLLPALILPERRAWPSGVAALLLVGLALNLTSPWFRIRWVKGRPWAMQQTTLERWNAFSYIQVEAERAPGYPSWGAKPRPTDPKVRFVNLSIDAGAGTWAVQRSDDRTGLSYLETDVANFAYHARTPETVLTIGVGGGRDIATALYFGAKQVTGVEINPIFDELLRTRFAQFTGHLATDPRVRVVIDEGRSWLQASGQSFDLIQMSLVDTWAATAAGAYVLSENTLYTVEAMQTFLQHLTPNGMVAISRHSFVPPNQLLRVVTTAREAMRQMGIADFGERVAVLRMEHHRNEGTGVCLLKRNPFTAGEVAALRQAATAMGMEVVYLPREPTADTLSAKIYRQFILTADPAPLLAAYPYDLEPSTDDWPFFFHISRLADIVKSGFGFAKVASLGPAQEQNIHAVALLFQVLVLVTLLTAAVILWPLLRGLRARGQASGHNSAPLRWRLTYFAALGGGFMFVEVPLVQRFAVYLGHPILALAVVLSALLLFCGLGALWLGSVAEHQLARLRMPLLLAIAALTIGGALGLDSALAAGRAFPTAVRIAISVALLAPAGLLLGTAFPLGVRTLLGARPHELAWHWGVNGACGVLGSVAVMALAIYTGFAAALVLGAAMYLLAALAMRRALVGELPSSSLDIPQQ
ncbi:MAG: hypothetical protein EXR77_00515 [Myxococcales bacterium]|nr:hypothetical protein [Myxococcales bacterium]